MLADLPPDLPELAAAAVDTAASVPLAYGRTAELCLELDVDHEVNLALDAGVS